MKRKKSGNLTIKEIALQSGVSVATVSRIMNNQEGYSEETRRKVQMVIDKTGYKPNAVARGLVKQRTHTIGVLLPEVTNRFSSELIHGIESVSHQNGLSVIICNTDQDGIRTREYLSVLSEKQVDGVIFCSEQLRDEYIQDLKHMRFPVVLVSTYSYKYQCPYIRVDDRMAAYSAVEFLIDKGHSRIGMVSGSPKDPIAGRPRIEGYRQALEDRDIAFSEDRISYGDFHYESGLKAAEVLLSRCPEITAIFAASDEMALGVLSYAYRSGRKVPDDLSVIAYDDTQDARMSIPPLTALHQPIFEMGEKAVNILLGLEKQTGGIIMPHYIVERESVREI